MISVNKCLFKKSAWGNNNQKKKLKKHEKFCLLAYYVDFSTGFSHFQNDNLIKNEVKKEDIVSNENFMKTSGF